MSYKGKRKKRVNPFLISVAFWVIAVILVIVSSRYAKAVCRSQEFERVTMPELYPPAEACAYRNRFCDVYREDCPLDAETQEALFEACEEFEIDYFLMLGLVEHETDFRNIIGDSGRSVGYCQIQPRWWTKLMQDIGAEDLENPTDNFRTACAILNELFDRYGCGNLTDVLTAYNSGHGGESAYADSVIESQTKWRDGNAR